MKTSEKYATEYQDLVDQEEKLDKRILQKIIRLCRQHPFVYIQKEPRISGKAVVDNSNFISWKTISEKIRLLKSIEKQIQNESSRIT